MHKGIDIPILSIVGRSKKGKTTLIELIIKDLSKRGYRVAAFKHAFHPLSLGLEKDAERLFSAGSIWSGVTSDEGISIFMGRTGDYRDVLNLFLEFVKNSVDIVILEGFKKLSFPKIEVFDGQSLVSSINDLIAVVGDEKPDFLGNIPFFRRDEVENISRYITDFFGI